MPTYGYRCEKCDLVFRDLNTISNRATTDCEDENCDGKANRDMDAELALSRGSQHKWITENERWSMSMGVPQASLAEYRKKFPNSVYNDKGDLLIKSRSDKKRQMAERGFCELDDNR
jgi:putative FmdB family regulatory protein